MPLGITMTRSEIMDWVPGSHASTFGGNPVCMAAALATLDVIEKEHLLENSAEVGAHMMKRMAELACEAEAGGRCARPRADDRRGHREGQDDQGIRPRRSATRSSRWRSSTECCSWAAGRARSACARRWWSRKKKRMLPWMCWRSAFSRSGSSLGVQSDMRYGFSEAVSPVMLKGVQALQGARRSGRPYSVVNRAAQISACAPDNFCVLAWYSAGNR